MSILRWMTLNGLDRYVRYEGLVSLIGKKLLPIYTAARGHVPSQDARKLATGTFMVNVYTAVDYDELEFGPIIRATCEAYVLPAKRSKPAPVNRAKARKTR